MKNILLSVIILPLLISVLSGQSKVSFGLEGGMALPMGSTADNYGVGFGAGAFAIIPTSSTSIGIVIGGNYLSMPGSTTTENKTISYPGYYSSTTITTTYEDLQVGSIYAGPKFGKETGIYFLPSLSFNFSSETRFGFYLGVGYLIPLKSIEINLGARYGILNVLGKDIDEVSHSGIAILAGVVF